MTLTIYPRAVWGPRRPNGDLTLYGPARGVFVHHSASAAPAHDLAAEVRAMRGLEATGYHRFGPGQGISYNFPIMPSGRVFEGVSVNRRGAHTGGLNSVVRSIVFVGNYEDAHPTAAQLESAAQLLAHGKRAGWWRGLILGGHRDVKGTACPGRHVYARLGDINARAAVLLGGPVETVDRPLVPDLDDRLDPTVGDLPAGLIPIDQGDDDVLFIARLKGRPEVWIGNTITRRHVKTPRELEDIRWSLKHAGVRVVERGEVASIDWLGVDVTK